MKRGYRHGLRRGHRVQRRAGKGQRSFARSLQQHGQQQGPATNPTTVCVWGAPELASSQTIEWEFQDSVSFTHDPQLVSTLAIRRPGVKGQFPGLESERENDGALRRPRGPPSLWGRHTPSATGRGGQTAAQPVWTGGGYYGPFTAAPGGTPSSVTRFPSDPDVSRTT